MTSKRNRHGSIPVPLASSPELFWVRLDRLQATCRAAGVEYAEGLEGWEQSGRYNRPVLRGVVIARRDAGRLAEGVARSRRAEAVADAAAVALELAWEALPESRWNVRSVAAALGHPIRVAVWADSLEEEHPGLADLLRRYVCPDYPKLDDPRMLCIRAMEAAGFTPASITLVERLIRSGADPDALRRANELIDSRGVDFTERELDAIFRRHLDDSHL